MAQASTASRSGTASIGRPCSLTCATERLPGDVWAWTSMRARRRCGCLCVYRCARSLRLSVGERLYAPLGFEAKVLSRRWRGGSLGSLSPGSASALRSTATPNRPQCHSSQGAQVRRLVPGMAGATICLWDIDLHPNAGAARRRTRRPHRPVSRRRPPRALGTSAQPAHGAGRSSRRRAGPSQTGCIRSRWSCSRG